MMPRGFPPECKLTPQLKEKVLATNPSRCRYGTCKWCNEMSETKSYRDRISPPKSVTFGATAQLLGHGGLLRQSPFRASMERCKVCQVKRLAVAEGQALASQERVHSFQRIHADMRERIVSEWFRVVVDSIAFKARSIIANRTPTSSAE
jgi:hypothetical protein